MKIPKGGEILQSMDLNSQDSIDKRLSGLIICRTPLQDQKDRPSIKHIYKEDLPFMPVSCLNTFTQDWVIKVKIVKKYDLKTWKNERGEGKILNVELMDTENKQI